MANDNLRQALDSAHIQPDDFAEQIGVDIRTVRRWLSGRPPYPRHRTKIAQALQIPEQALWPDLPPPTHPQARDLITGYPSADSIGIPSPEGLIQAAGEQIDLLDHTLAEYLAPSGLTELLLTRASEGVLIRIMVAAPGYHLAPLLNQPGIEVRAVGLGEQQTVHRYDDDMLVTVPLAGNASEPPLLLHIQRRGSGGLFDRFASHYQDSWDTATDPLETEADIEEYLRDDLDEDEDDEQTDTDDTTAGVPPPLTPDRPAPIPRQWPRRRPES